MNKRRADGAAVYISDLWVLDPQHFRLNAVLFGGEIVIRSCRALWRGRHVVDVFAPFSVLPGGRCRAQVHWSESLHESIRAAAEIAIVEYLEHEEAGAMKTEPSRARFKQ